MKTIALFILALAGSTTAALADGPSAQPSYEVVMPMFPRVVNIDGVHCLVQTASSEKAWCPGAGYMAWTPLTYMRRVQSK